MTTWGPEAPTGSSEEHGRPQSRLRGCGRNRASHSGDLRAPAEQAQEKGHTLLSYDSEVGYSPSYVDAAGWEIRPVCELGVAGRTRRGPRPETTQLVTDLVLVRHGETVWHAENRYAGRSDVALTKRGHEQAQALARWTAAADLDALWCSELRRSRETAAPCAAASGLVPRVDPRLNEVDFGHGEGLTAYELRQRFPLEVDAFSDDPVGHPLPGAEDPRAATARALACLTEISEEFPHGRVLVVAHNSLIRLTLCHLLRIPLSEYRRLFPFIRNCSLNEIRLLSGKQAALLQFNAPLHEDEPLSLEIPRCLD